MTMDRTVLTDVSENVWLDEFSVSETSSLKLSGSADWSIKKRKLRGGPSDGIDLVEVDNGVLSVSVLPTRGMGLWRGRCRGVDLGWQSPVSQPVHPSFVNLTDRSGLGWLKGFNEWMCRCGLASLGPPGMDVVLDAQGNTIETPLTLHGKIANTPAHRVEVRVSTEGSGLLAVTGVVDETMLFGPCLRLTSTLEMEAGANRLRIIDAITNLGGQPAELQLLYHTNIGRGLLEAGSQFVAPVAEVVPATVRAAEGIDSWMIYEKPVPGYTEQNYYVDLRADEHGKTLVLLKNSSADKGLSLHFNRRELPYFIIWKNTQAEEDGYVTGLEPATSLPNLKTFERQQGRVIQLEPQQTYRAGFEVAVHVTADEIRTIEQEIADVQGSQQPVVHRRPLAKFSPGGS